MPRNARQTEATPDPTALPGAVMAMTLHMVESRIALMGDLARCGTPAEANTVMTQWFERRLAEFSEDQARIAAAVIESFAAAANGTMQAVNGMAGAVAGNGRKDAAPH